MANELANILLLFLCLFKVGLVTGLLIAVPAVLIWERRRG